MNMPDTKQRVLDIVGAGLYTVLLPAAYLFVMLSFASVPMEQGLLMKIYGYAMLLFGLIGVAAAWVTPFRQERSGIFSVLKIVPWPFVVAPLVVSFFV
jgi:hypothetical protein